MKFDDDQKYAVMTDGNLLVSASAGSGKTAVLTERFLRLVKEGIEPKNILVLTFSEKAAAEMKERIEGKLTEYAAEKDAKTAAELIRGFALANISTIHSFLSKLLTKYFYELNIDPYFSIISEGDAESLKRRAFETAAARYNTAEEGDGGVYERLVQNLSGSRSDEKLFAAAEEYRELLTVMPDKEYDFERSLKAAEEYILSYIRERLEKLLKFAEEILAECTGGEKYAFIAEEIYEKLNGILNAGFTGKNIKNVRYYTAEKSKKSGAKKRRYTAENYESDGFESDMENDGTYDGSGLEFDGENDGTYGGSGLESDAENDGTYGGSELESDAENDGAYGGSGFESDGDTEDGFEDGGEDGGDSEEGKAENAKISFIAAIMNCSVCAARIMKKNADELTEKISALKSGFNDELKNRFQAAAGSIGEWKDLALRDRALIEKFVEFSRYYTAKYDELKRADNKLDYSDLESFASALLENAEILSEIKSQYTRILVDEYQDTNRVQEHILSRLSTGEFFTVGDVKQSIFSFRLADPSIFLERLSSYESGGGKWRNLNNNYRTSKRITGFINDVFSCVMTEESGGVNYGRDAMLIAKAEFAPEKYTPYAAAFFPKRTERFSAEGLYGVKNDANFAGRSAAEDEGLYIADTINKLLKTEIYIPSEGRYRPVNFGDIAVIFRSKKNDNAACILSFLKDAGIPLSEEVSAGRRETVIELLKVVENARNDIPLAASLTSFFGGVTAEELKEIRLNDCGGKYFFDSVLKYIGEKEDALADKLRAFVDYIYFLRKKAADGDMYSLVSEIVYGSGYDDYIGGAAEVRGFAEGFYGYEYSLRHFLHGGRAETAEKSETGGGGVSILTVHASKGLEFPIVFIADCAKRFNSEDERGPFVLDSELGIGLYHKDLERLTKREGIFRRAIVLKKDKQSRGEELRLLYVAATRAKNHLFISGSGAEQKDGYWDVVYKEAESFMDFVRTAAYYRASVADAFIKAEERESAVFCAESAIPDITSGYDKRVAAYLAERLKEKTAAADKSPLKESATAVSKGKKLSFAEPPKGIFDRGNAYHKVMQHIDFCADFRGIEARIKELVKEDVLSAEEAALVNVRDVERCLKSGIIEYAKKNTCLREKEFMLYIPSKEMYADGDESKILVQGVIDLLVFGEKNIIADYKTGRTEGFMDAYKKQLAVYKRAAESAGIRIDGTVIYSFEEGEIWVET
ncbi:MAG: UvrD-helicase domain-containing protein [Clostridiales bacterium]|jgi:ATP-dependent helicase/nuclease subunit A|nr:UvrD-helicase domain-containing protein [Clostridiales bacterium]